MRETVQRCPEHRELTVVFAEVHSTLGTTVPLMPAPAVYRRVYLLL